MKRHEVRVKRADQLPKVLVVVGDTLLVRDYIVNDLKPRFSLSIQIVPATIKRNSQTFKAQIFDGSQCNASFRENGFLRGDSQPEISPQLSKLLLFEDIDIVFADESEFYP